MPHDAIRKAAGGIIKMEKMEVYKRTIDYIVSKTLIHKECIFDYQDSPYRKEFDSSFQFYFKELITQSEFYEIKPFLLYFKNDTRVNASAFTNNGFNIISINMGTVVKLINRFKLKTDLLTETGNDDFCSFEKLLDMPINELVYQTAIRFTFYHELGHIIQKSDLLNEKMHERVLTLVENPFENHVYEIDADRFSSLCIGTHLIQYYLRVFKGCYTAENMEKLIIITCSSTLFYLLSFNTNRKEIYFEENSHPHPVIRITNIVFDIMGYCLQSMASRGFSLMLDKQTIIDKTLFFSNSIAKKKYSEDIIENYVLIIKEKTPDIIDYMEKINDAIENDDSLSSFKWNVLAKKIGINTI